MQVLLLTKLSKTFKEKALKPEGSFKAAEVFYRDAKEVKLGDLKRWPEWMPWSKERDPSVEYTFSGQGVGAEMKWTGKKLGNSSLILTSIDGRNGIGYDSRFAGSDDPGHGTLRLEPVGTGTATTVVWHETGDVGWNPMYRLIVRLIEGALSRDFALGLERLKKRAEASG